ncbi:MAG: YbbC/YhhH family protein [Candidatus Methylacidiphilales bacterium]
MTFILIACEQTKNHRIILGKEYAEQEIKSLLIDKHQHNVIDNKTVIIKDSLTAITVAEPILFSIYGKDNITKQRPYEIYFIDNYWLITGTLPSGWKGGTFLIIIDSRNSKIIRITHGK